MLASHLRDPPSPRSVPKGDATLGAPVATLSHRRRIGSARSTPRRHGRAGGRKREDQSREDGEPRRRAHLYDFHDRPSWSFAGRPWADGAGVSMIQRDSFIKRIGPRPSLNDREKFLRHTRSAVARRRKCCAARKADNQAVCAGAGGCGHDSLRDAGGSRKGSRRRSRGPLVGLNLTNARTVVSIATSTTSTRSVPNAKAPRIIVRVWCMSVGADIRTCSSHPPFSVRVAGVPVIAGNPRGGSSSATGNFGYRAWQKFLSRSPVARGRHGQLRAPHHHSHARARRRFSSVRRRLASLGRDRDFSRRPKPAPSRHSPLSRS